MYEARNSIYCYSGTDVLINKLEIKDQTLLNDFERYTVSLKLLDLEKQNQIGDFSVHHFIEIHKFLFGEIYPFAGTFRTENIAKDDFCFAEWEFIEDELTKLLNQLKEEKFLGELSENQLAGRLAYYMAELNVLHPFREGNGRTIREFIRQLALKNGYYLNFGQVSADELLRACISSVVDEKELAQVILKCLKK